MAHNLKLEDEVFSILTDITRHYFRDRRSINPSSMLYQAAKYADDEGYIVNADIEDGEGMLVASVDLTNAVLTDKGTEFLETYNPEEKDGRR